MPGDTITIVTPERTLFFCCQGCKMVYTLLMEAADSLSPEDFCRTELFRRCQEAGIIPGGSPVSDAAPRAAVHPPTSEDPEHLLRLDCRIEGMWCPACAWVIESAIKGLRGVAEADCNFSIDRFSCRYDPAQVSPGDIQAAVSRLGYTAVESASEFRDREIRSEWIRFGISAFLTMNVMMLSFSMYSGFFTRLTPIDIRLIGWPMAAMTMVVLVYGGGPMFKKGWAGLISGAPGMETLVGIGSASTALFSLYQLIRDSHLVYFDTATMLITLVLLGKRLENHAREGIRKDIDALLTRMPAKIRRVSPGFPRGRYETMERLLEGDLFVVEEQEVAGADGVVESGDGSMDESSLTGEAAPVAVGPGSPIRAGSVMVRGRVTVRATAVGRESTFGQMIEIISAALNRKLPQEARTDRILRWFTPLMVALAGIAGVAVFFLGESLEESVIRAVTVLVVSCPCAMGIAVPLARATAVSLAGRDGILVRDAAAFEKSPSVTAVVFDKTGTVTTGKWILQEMVCLPGEDPEYVLAAAASLERSSGHYLAAAILAKAGEEGISIPTAESVRACPQGMEGWLKGEKIRIGSCLWVVSDMAGGSFSAWVPDENADPFSRVYMTIANRPAAVFVFGDSIRPFVSRMVSALVETGRRVALISGDDSRSVRNVAQEVGISDYQGNLLPLEKAEYIQKLQEREEITAMVGDGINDGPALAQADLAVAIHSGYHLARESADITLMRGDPSQLMEFMALSIRVNRIISQNLRWALVYNLTAVPIAMIGLLTPLVAVSAMLASSLSVVGNTLRLTRGRPSAADTSQ